MVGKICIHEIIAMEHKALLNIKGMAEKYKNKYLYKSITTHYYNKNIKYFAHWLLNMYT